jgi:L-alanine-DL-glutamate epimerase-like enolase superfamily enzyme
MQVQDGYAIPPDAPGLGIAWDWAAISNKQTTYLEIKAP